MGLAAGQPCSCTRSSPVCTEILPSPCCVLAWDRKVVLSKAVSACSPPPFSDIDCISSSRTTAGERSVSSNLIRLGGIGEKPAGLARNKECNLQLKDM